MTPVITRLRMVPYIFAERVCPFLLLALLGLSSTMVFSQAPEVSSGCWAAWKGSAPAEEMLTSIRAQYAADLKGIKFNNYALQRAVVEDRKELQTDLLKSLEDEQFIFGTPLNALLDSVMDLLVGGNPEIVRPRLLLSWYPWPNASCRGEGTIVVDLGLMERIRTRSELAFVMAHELAHQQLDHVNSSIVQVNQHLLSKEFKAEVRATMRKEYNRVAELERLFVGFSVNERRHSRNHEIAADSLGLIFLLHTPFDPAAALSTMDMLDRCDNERDSLPIDAHWAFEYPGVAFDARWTGLRTVSSLAAVDTRDHVLEDSLKTHPDCMKRKRVLAAELSDTLPGNWAAESTAYEPYAHMSSYATIESAFRSDDAGRAIFLALQLLKSDPGNAYLNAALARGFATLSVCAAEHRLSHVLDQPTKRQARSYAQLLQALNDMRISDMGALADHYLSMARATDPRCEDTVYTTALLAYGRKNATDLDQAKSDYLSTFPDGRLTERIGELTLAPPAKH